MANPLGESMFNPQPVFGAVERAQELQREAPISGAPTPTGASSAGAAPQGPAGAPGPVMFPAVGAPPVSDYYARLVATWKALASLPGAAPIVREMATNARAHQRTQHRLSQESG